MSPKDPNRLFTKNDARREKFQKIRRELSIRDIEWMQRREEFLLPKPVALDDPAVSSRLGGPQTCTLQLERITVVETKGEIMKFIRMLASIAGGPMPEFGIFRDF